MRLDWLLPRPDVVMFRWRVAKALECTMHTMSQSGDCDGDESDIQVLVRGWQLLAYFSVSTRFALASKGDINSTFILIMLSLCSAFRYKLR